jgi:transcriptional regulator with XRE-family HTH domain
MPINPAALTLRTKIIGTLLRDARLAADKEIEECAEAISVSAETYEAYELGSQPISLPELESLAYVLDVPLEHFWGNETLPSNGNSKPRPKMDRLIPLRHRMIGVILRQARLDAGLSLEELAQRLKLEASQLEAFELGLEPVPLPQLEILSGLLNRSIREFQDLHGPVGVWNAEQRALQDFLSMPHDLQVFVSKPINRPYLDLALRLSEINVDRLRAVAEGLLEITY